MSKIPEFRMHAIEVVAKQIVYPPVLPDTKDVLTGSRFDLELIEEGSFVVVTVEVMYTEEGKKTEFAYFKTFVGFEFKNFNEVFPKDEKNELTIDVKLESFLLAESYSTTRGIIYAELRGTFLEGVLIPLKNIGAEVRNTRAKGHDKK